MNKEFEATKKLYKNNILQRNLDIQKLTEDMNNNNNKIKLLTITIETEHKINNEIDILENKIKKHKEIITQSEKDLRGLV